MDIGASDCGGGASANAFSKLCGQIFAIADAAIADQVVCGK